MDSIALRSMQDPFKQRYRVDPDSAMITLRADGELGAESVTCSVSTGRALVEVGLHPATGGDGIAACSGDMLLQALVACAGVTLRAALDTGASEEQLATLLRLTERYCVVYQTLAGTPELAVQTARQEPQ